jgi:hypothetical protein
LPGWAKTRQMPLTRLAKQKFSCVNPVCDDFVTILKVDACRLIAVFDLDAGPVTVTLPDAGKRFMSMQVVNEDQYSAAGRVKRSNDNDVVGVRNRLWPSRSLAGALGEYVVPVLLVVDSGIKKLHGGHAPVGFGAGHKAQNDLLHTNIAVSRGDDDLAKDNLNNRALTACSTWCW